MQEITLASYSASTRSITLDHVSNVSVFRSFASAHSAADPATSAHQRSFRDLSRQVLRDPRVQISMAGRESRKMKSRVADSLTRRAIEQYSRAVLYLSVSLPPSPSCQVVIPIDTSSVWPASSPLSHPLLTSQSCCLESPVERSPSHPLSAMLSREGWLCPVGRIERPRLL